MKKKPWSQTELEYLTDNYKSDGALICGEYLGRTPNSVKKRATRLGVCRSRVNFSESEVEYIKQHYSNDGPVAISKALSKKRDSVYGVAQRLGLLVSHETRSRTSKKNYKLVFTAEVRKKIGDGQRKYDSPATCMDCGKEVLTRKQLRCFKCNRKLYRGENSNLWQGGKSSFYQTIAHKLWLSWKKPILERDGFKCTTCGSKKDLEVHHIDKFSTLRDGILKEYPHLSPEVAEEKVVLCKLIIEAHDNVKGTTLCRICHRKLHFANGVNCLGTPRKEDNQQRSLTEMC